MSIALASLYEFTRQNLDDNYVTNGKWSQEKYNQYMLARAFFPGYSSYADYQLGMQQLEWYMQRYGMTWEDVRNPWNLPGSDKMQGAYDRVASRVLNYMSSNVNRLYRNKRPSRDDELSDEEMARRLYKHGFNPW